MASARSTVSVSFAAAGLLGLLATGCGYRNVPPPPPPAITVPDIDDPPAAAPAEGASRLFLDVEGERASVYRQIEVAHPTRPPQRSRDVVVAFDRYELLCVTPCATDLRRGAHVLRFESLTDAERRSEALVLAPREPTVVRHALGHTEAPGAGYYASGVAVIGASIFGLFGSFTLVSGLAQDDTPPKDDKGLGRDASIRYGLISLGIGTVLGALGALGMNAARPERQPGSTIQFAKP